MGFNVNTTPAASNVTAGNFKKADAFINFRKADDTGKNHSVGSIPLYKDNPLHAFIIAHTTANPEKGLQEVLATCSVDIKSATPAVNNATFSLKAA